MQEMVIQEEMEWKQFIYIYKFALDEVNTKLRILNEEFQFVHQHNPIEHVKSRVKTKASIISKLQRKGLEVTVDHAREHIMDIAGVRIICSFVSDMYKIKEMLEQQNDIKIIDIKDYIKHPKSNGYKSLHMIIEIPVFLSNRTEHMKVEIQIRTVAMDFWASLEHKIFYKYEGTVPFQLLNELKEAADAIDFLDQKMEKINQKMEPYKGCL